MKRRVACLLCIAGLFGAGTIHADEAETWSRRITLGGHAGVDFATLGGSELDDEGVDYSYRTGFAGGGILDLGLTRVLSAQLELDFVTKGFRGETDFPSTSGTQHMSYLEVPILLRGAVPISQAVELYGYGGPAFGVLLDASIEFDDGNSLELDRSVKRFDIGLLFGAGVAVNVRDAGAITFDVRYNLGVRDWSTVEDSDNTVINRAIYLTVGYRADLATLGRLFGGAPR